jgi:hypothetical protein
MSRLRSARLGAIALLLVAAGTAWAPAAAAVSQNWITVTPTLGSSSIKVGTSTTLSVHVSADLVTGHFAQVSFAAENSGLALTGHAGSCDGYFGAWSTQVTLQQTDGGSGINCTFTVDITAVTPGSYSNPLSVQTYSGGSLDGVANRVSYVAISVYADDPPAAGAHFSAPSVVVGHDTNLVIALGNSPANAQAMSGIAFTVNLPAGITVETATSSVCGGTLTTTAPGTIAFSGGALAIGAECSVSVAIHAETIGNYTVPSFSVATDQSPASAVGPVGIAVSETGTVTPPPTATSAPEGSNEQSSVWLVLLAALAALAAATTTLRLSAKLR